MYTWQQNYEEEEYGDEQEEEDISDQRMEKAHNEIEQGKSM
jgi:hypothetical protein